MKECEPSDDFFYEPTCHWCGEPEDDCACDNEEEPFL